MKGWREAIAAKSERARPQDNRDVRDKMVKSTANVSIVPIVPLPLSLSLRQWHNQLSAVDDFKPPTGIDLNDWLELIDDAHWLYENFAREAAELGWTGSDLFGLRDGSRGDGGLADSLHGARHLHFAGKLAVYSNWGARGYFAASNDPALSPLWEAV